MEHVIFENSKQHFFKLTCFQLLRPLTLSATISPILVGTLIVFLHQGQLRWQSFILLLLASLCIQMATNIWNDYFDFKKGQDRIKWQHQQDSIYQLAHHQLPYMALLFTMIAMMLGLWLAMITTLWLIPIGVTGILCGIYYSAGNPSLSQVGLGELTGAIFLGITNAILPFIVQHYYPIKEIAAIALLFAILISIMILTNNIRDIEKDTPFRKTIAIALGRRKAIGLLKALIFSVYGFLIIFIILNIIPIISFLSVVGLLAVFPLLNCFKGNVTNPKCMKLAAYHHWLIGMGLALSLIIAYIMH